MPIHVYAPVMYPGTTELLDALQAKRLTKFDGMRFLHKGTPIEFRPKDVIICWGHHVPTIPGTITLNANCLYHDQLQLNLRTEHLLAAMGVMKAQPINIGIVDYKRGLELFRKNANAYKSPAHKGWPRFVPMEEFPTYGIQYQSFQSKCKATVLGGQLFFADDIVGDKEKIASMILKVLGLDFGTVTIAQVGGSSIPFVTKILTAVKLDATTAPVFAKALLAYIEKKK